MVHRPFIQIHPVTTVAFGVKEVFQTPNTRAKAMVTRLAPEAIDPKNFQDSIA
jgi:hypothetical protein